MRGYVDEIGTEKRFIELWVVIDPPASSSVLPPSTYFKNTTCLYINMDNVYVVY